MTRKADMQEMKAMTSVTDVGDGANCTSSHNAPRSKECSSLNKKLSYGENTIKESFRFFFLQLNANFRETRTVRTEFSFL